MKVILNIMVQGYPESPEVLSALIDGFFELSISLNERIHGLIVPHGAYEFCGNIAGKAFTLLKQEKFDKIVIFGPSHDVGFRGVLALDSVETPLGKVKIINNDYEKIGSEHSVMNQIPFLQKIDSDLEVLPLVVGQIDFDEAREIAERFLGETTSLFVFSANLSDHLSYDECVKEDKGIIKRIEGLDFERFGSIKACGIYPLLVMHHLCKMNKWKPKLIEYKNSGDILNRKRDVIGYASLWF